MKAGRKTVLRIALCLLALFILINAVWFIWRTVKYGAYCKGLEKNEFATWIVPRYKHTDADGFDYNVKYPEYLSFTGNLGVGSPGEGDNLFTDGLIIWPKVSGGYEYGVMIMEEDQGFQIYIHADGSAVYPKDSEVVARNQERISALLRRAEEMWDLE